MKRISMIIVLVMGLPLSICRALTADQIIDEAPVVSDISGATDLQADLENLVTGLVNDTSNYNCAILQHNHTYPLVLYFRGRVTGTLAPLLPLLPGTIVDVGTLRGKLAARLRAEVTGYLLVQGLWDFEYQYNQDLQGAVQWYTPMHNTKIGWHHRFRSGPHWEKFYAVWAYCHYSGDWTVLTNNGSAGLNFLKSRYAEGNRVRSEQRYMYGYHAGGSDVYREDPNNLANGLIGFTRILDHFNDIQESAVRSEARTALGYVIDVTWVNRSAANGAVRIGWDNTPQDIRYDYPPGECLTPELARWLRDQRLATVTTRVNEAISMTELKDRYNAHMFNNYTRSWPVYDEAVWGLPCISYQLYNLKALVIQEPIESLRAERPWPVVMGRIPKYRDMLYLQSLYYLLMRHGTVSWQTAEPD